MRAPQARSFARHRSETSHEVPVIKPLESAVLAILPCYISPTTFTPQLLQAVNRMFKLRNRLYDNDYAINITHICF